MLQLKDIKLFVIRHFLLMSHMCSVRVWWSNEVVSIGRNAVNVEQHFHPLPANGLLVMSAVTSGKPSPLLGKQERCHGLAYPSFTTYCCKLYRRMREGKVQKARVHVVRWCEFRMIRRGYCWLFCPNSSCQLVDTKDTFSSQHALHRVKQFIKKASVHSYSNSKVNNFGIKWH